VSEALDKFNEHNDTYFVDDSMVDDIIQRLPFCDPPNMDDCNVIYYIAGYIAKSVSAMHKCTSCSDHLKSSDRNILPVTSDAESDVSDLFHQLNRGGLCDPSSATYNIGVRCWCIFSSIKSCPQISSIFLTCPNARVLFVTIMQKILMQEESILLCDNGHDVATAVITKFFNCTAKNWIATLNQEGSSAK
jgi:hypothetical protein